MTLASTPLTLPGRSPSTLRPTDFDDDMDARLAWENINVTEMNALLPAIDAAVSDVSTNMSAAVSAAAAAAASQSAASASATAAAASASAASSSQTAAATSQTAASNSASAAAASAASAAAIAGAFIGTSTSSLTIGAGNKTFVTQAGEQYSPGVFMTAVSAANGANYMFGQVVSYSGTSLVLSISMVGGSGTFADWNLSLAGPQGVQGLQGVPGAGVTPQANGFTAAGGTTSRTLTVDVDLVASNVLTKSGGSLTGALNEARGADIASAATINLTAATGNVVDVTGTTAITAITLADGATRTLRFTAALTLTNSANLILPGAANIVTAAGDFAVVRGYASGVVRVTSYQRANGAALVSTSAGVGGSSVTGSVALTAAMTGAILATPTAPGMYMTLPDATTCMKATGLFSVYNASDFDYGVKDGAGTQLGWVRPRSSATFGLSDNATAAGVWVLVGVEKLGVTAKYTLSGLTSTGYVQARVAVDANRTLFLVGTGSGAPCSLYAIVHDAASGTWGSTVVRSTGISSNQMLAKAVLSGASQVLVASIPQSSTAMEVVTLTIAGVAVTPNTPTSVTLDATCGAGIGSQIAQVGTSFVIPYTDSAPSTKFRVATVSGTAVTIGAQYVLPVGAANVPAVFIAGSVARFVCADNSNVWFYPYTISGTVATLGTGVTTACTGQGVSAYQNATGNIVTFYMNSNLRVAVTKLTGAAEAVTTALLAPQSNGPQSTTYIELPSSRTVAITISSGSSAYATIFTDTSGIVTAGASLAISNINYCAAVLAAGTSARFIWSISQKSTQVTLDCSGVTPVVGATVSLGVTADTLSDGPSFSLYPRSPNKLFVGTRMYGIASTSSPDNTLISDQSAFSVRAPIQAAASPAVAGAALNETWTSNFNAMTQIYSIQRIEAAA